jgi:pilus assembly protein Flp/PilA
MIDFLKIQLDARLAKMEERGASAVEYGLLVAAIAAVIILVIFALGDNIKSLFSSTCDAIQGQASTSGSSCA